MSGLVRSQKTQRTQTSKASLLARWLRGRMLAGFSHMRLRAGLASAMAMVLQGWGCASPPQWKLPPGLSSGSRVRVVAPRLGRAWEPGRVQLSTDGCWTIAVGVTHDTKAITILTPGDLTRLQLSKAVPPPDWWAMPEEAEGWTEVSPDVLEEAAAPKCKHRRHHAVLFYFGPTTAQRYTSSVTTRVISGLAPAAAARTSSSEVNW